LYALSWISLKELFFIHYTLKKENNLVIIISKELHKTKCIYFIMNEINDLIDGYIIHIIYSTIIYNKINNRTIFDYCNYYEIDYNIMMNSHHTK
jgi:hypothetical protein